MNNLATKIVKESDRCDFLPNLFGRKYVQIESMVFDITKKFVGDEIDNPYWDFVEVSGNIGDDNSVSSGYMRPIYDGKVTTTNALNYSCEELSADALGICVSLIAMSEATFHETDDDALERITKNYYALSEFMMGHAEVNQMLKIID